MIRVLFHLVDIDESDPDLAPIATYLPIIAMFWEDVVKSYALDGLIVVDQTSAGLAASLTFEGFEFAHFRSLAEAEAAYRDARWIYFEHGGQPLSTFEHPAEDAIYDFGPDTVGLPLEPGKTYVEIPTVRRWGFFSPIAAAIVFYDPFRPPPLSRLTTRQRRHALDRFFQRSGKSPWPTGQSCWVTRLRTR